MPLPNQIATSNVETKNFASLKRSDEPIAIAQASRTPAKIYFDFQATTPVDPRVLDAMLPYFTKKYGNPHSRTHSFGWESEKAVETARKQVADLIGAHEKEIIFTSGATESNNLAIKGAVDWKAQDGNPVHVITTQVEHKCVLDSMRFLEEKGARVTYMKVNKDGVIDLEELKRSISDDTVLVSIMGVNNEIGTVQPLEEIGKICKERNVLFHCDAAQMFGKLKIDVNKMNIDLLSISGHKIYGPKGVGALYVRRRPRVRLVPLFSGGGQERGLRSGTLPTPLIVGLGKAAAVCQEEMQRDLSWIESLSKKLYTCLKENIPNVIKNGSLQTNPLRWFPGCLNLSFPHVEGEGLLMALKNIALSSGSACTSASLEPSYVLRALGNDDELAHSSIRFGIGRFTTPCEIKEVAKQTTSAVKKLRDMSPLYEMEQEGIDLKTIKWT
ncbi:Cysteine desulfurase NFS1 [Trachipleistophora hominis]|uniref:Cysteine desulfurase n=1 Tax=Trachipleistophora hominis TaxID=72359 RepID=NFS1_TRAHO|nr:RecName: Full=Cysteine desulfurase, mitosomal [Trachipleistophora hominis]ABS58597.1 cysteine desulfurase Nfsp [Trachipleistophora hominis]ELQ76591.1 Cysteine desulfurase NFS1 [Trachipleistophora hominis]